MYQQGCKEVGPFSEVLLLSSHIIVNLHISATWLCPKHRVCTYKIRLPLYCSRVPSGGHFMTQVSLHFLNINYELLWQF